MQELHHFEEPVGDGVPPLRLVAIPSGEFIMGSVENEPGGFRDERPLHSVKVAQFFMSKFPVTQAQWRAIATRTDLKVRVDLDPDPSEFEGDGRPVEQVSWNEAVEFCDRLSRLTHHTYRLPTEAEWEYACRAGTTTPFYSGETITTDLANYNGMETTPVGQFPPNAFGLYDMHGNVWEWCLDHWRDSYAGAPTDGSAWFTDNEGANRVRRGGSWDNLPRHCRSAYRSPYYPGNSNDNIGFRVLCENRAWFTDNEGANRVRRGGSWYHSPRHCRSAYRYYNDPGTRDDYLGFRVLCEDRGL